MEEEIDGGRKIKEEEGMEERWRKQKMIGGKERW